MDKLIKFKDEGKENPLLKRPDLMEAAFSQFSRVSFNEASLNAILQEAGVNKGSFYFKFYDKMDLYLCLMEQIAIGKVMYLSGRMANVAPSDDIFDQLRQIAIGSLEYAMKEPRYNALWRLFLSESDELRKKVKAAFPELKEDALGKLVDSAFEKGQLTDRYDRDFINSVVGLYFGNMDAFITPGMTSDEIAVQVDKVISILKESVGKQ